MTFKFGDKVWDTRVSGWVLVIAVDEKFGTVCVRSFENPSSMHDFTYTLEGKDNQHVQRLFQEKPKEPRFAPGTPLVVKHKDDGTIYTFIAGVENASADSIYNAAKIGLFPYKSYDFFVVDNQYQVVT
jgi:hypothetical protein